MDKIMKSIYFAIAAATVAVTSVMTTISPVFAFGLQGYSITAGGDTATDTFTIGNRFTVGASDISVDALGFYDDGQNGLIANHDVALWTGSGTLLRQVVVSAGTVDPLVGFFRYGTISPITLSAGQTYVVAGQYNDLTDSYTTNYSGLSIDPAINNLVELDVSSTSITFPVFSQGTLAQGRAIGANIDFNLVSVPFEFSPAFGLSILGGLYLARNYAKKIGKKRI